MKQFIGLGNIIKTYKITILHRKILHRKSQVAVKGCHYHEYLFDHPASCHRDQAHESDKLIMFLLATCVDRKHHAMGFI